MTHRTIPTLLMTAAAVFPSGVLIAGAATRADAASSRTSARAVTATTATAATKTTTRVYVGPVESMRWGDVRVTITVKGKRIINVTATTPTERDRSVFLNHQAVPLRRQEVLKAQSAAIYEVSGATMTSDAYDASLQAAIATAKKAHAL